VFDFIENYNLKRNGIISPQSNIFTYLGKTATMDKNKLWIGIGWMGRLILKVVVFAVALWFWI
jgi:hypothetical protein